MVRTLPFERVVSAIQKGRFRYSKGLFQLFQRVVSAIQMVVSAVQKGRFSYSKGSFQLFKRVVSAIQKCRRVP